MQVVAAADAGAWTGERSKSWAAGYSLRRTERHRHANARRHTRTGTYEPHPTLRKTAFRCAGLQVHAMDFWGVEQRSKAPSRWNA
jgi:hypothetical protein